MATSSSITVVKLGQAKQDNSGSSSKTARYSSQTSLHSLDAVHTAKARCLNPDRALDQDCTELNLNKQKYEQDPRKALDEIVGIQKEIKKVIEEHITKPFIAIKSHERHRQKDPQDNTVAGERNGKEEQTKNDPLVIKDKVAAKKKYLIVHFSYYFIMGNVTKKFHYPAEFSVAEFSVFNGLGNGVSGLIDIGAPPLGYKHDIRDRQKVTANPYPTFDEDFDADVDALKRIEDFCRPHFPDGETILLFTPKEYIPIVADGFHWLFDQSGRTLNIEILPLSCLVQILANESQKPEYRSSCDPVVYHVSHESHLENVLHSQQYGTQPDLACEYHAMSENEHGVAQCAELMVKRFAFNSCRFLTAFFKVTENPNKHFPGYKTFKSAVIKKRGGFKVFEMPEGRLRISDIRQFPSCDRINKLLRSRASSTNISTSQDSLYSSESGSKSSVSSGGAHGKCQNPYESRPSLSSSGGCQSSSSSSTSIAKSIDDIRKELNPADLVDVPSGWDSQKLLREYRVVPEIPYRHSLNPMDESMLLPANYLPKSSPFEDAFRERFNKSRINEVAEKHKQSMGRGKVSSKYQNSSNESIAPSRPPVTFEDSSQDSLSSVSAGAVIAQRKKIKPKYSRAWDAVSTKSSTSNQSNPSVASVGSSSNQAHLGSMQERQSNVGTAGSPAVFSLSNESVPSGSLTSNGKEASSSKASFGSEDVSEGNVGWPSTKRIGRSDSTSTIPDSASACGYQVDDLNVSSEDETCEDEDSMSIVALKRVYIQ